MSITYKAIIEKMINELQEAKKHDQAVIKKHINHVYLLCELILDEELKGENMNDEEMKTMIGDTYKSEKESSYTEPESDSIFDF